MRRPGEVVHARRLGDLDVPAVARVRMGQRHVAHPIVAFGVQVNDQRIGLGPLPEAFIAPGKRVGDGDEGEGVVLRRPLMLFVLAWVAADLREALVLKQAATARVRMHRIEDAPAGRVHVPALIDVFADDASAQGGAGAVDLLDVAGQRMRVPGGVVGLVAQQREEVTDTEEAEIHHARAFRLVDEFVDPARLEAALDVEVDRRWREQDLPVLDLRPGQLPLRVRYG